MLAVVAGVVGLGVWAFDVPSRLRAGPDAKVAADVGSVPDSRAMSSVQDAGAAAGMAVRAEGRIPAADGVMATGALDGVELPPELAAAARAIDPAQRSASVRLDAGAAAELQAKAKQAQKQLEALGHAQGGAIPEDDPAVLEQLPPDIRELYRARMGR